MGPPRWTILWASLMASYWAISTAIPANIVAEIKSSGLRDNKVKRAHAPVNNNEERGRDIPYFSKPTAIKRGANNLKNLSPEQQSLSEWEQEQRALYQNPENLQSSLYNGDNNLFDEKTVAEYEKGFHYGTNKEKLDEALENAVLKAEMYGDPSSINQYRYFGNEERRRRRRRRDANARPRLDSRMKRDVELSPEDVLTILTLYENEQRNQNNPYNSRPRLFNPENDPNADIDLEDDENWLDTPVYPHATGHGLNDIGPNYIFDEKPYEKRERWGGFADRKKLMARKRNDPTRELRYLNGPNKNDFYTLSQLLSNQREPNVPVYHRLIL